MYWLDSSIFILLIDVPEASCVSIYSTLGSSRGYIVVIVSLRLFKDMDLILWESTVTSTSMGESFSFICVEYIPRF